MHSVHADLQVCVCGHADQLAEVHVQLQLDFLLVFALVSLLNGWIACVHTIECMFLHPLHAINNSSHLVYSLPNIGMDL